METQILNKCKDTSHEVDLEKMRKEFQDFTYIVSHDLNAPLRYIREFNKLFLKRIENKMADSSFDEKELQFSQIIDSNICKLEQRLEGLLQYSRLNTDGIKFENVNLPALLESIQKRFIKDSAQLAPQITVNNIPQCFSCENLMYQLFTYIIDNSIKFNGSSIPNIVIDCRIDSESYHFSIEDNGIGIKPDLTEDAFNLFRQLHPEGTYPGIGMGLTLAKKIVEIHQGKIHIAQNKKSGCTVNFTVSKHLNSLQNAH